MENGIQKPLGLKILLAFMWMVFIIGPLMGFVLAGMLTFLGLWSLLGRGRFGVFEVIQCVCLCLWGVVVLLYPAMLTAFGRGQDWARKSLFRCNVLNAVVCFVSCLFCFGFGSDFILEVLDGVCIREGIGTGVGSGVAAVLAGVLLLPPVRDWCKSYDGREGELCVDSQGWVVKILLSVYRIVFALAFAASCAISPNCCNIIDSCRDSLHALVTRNSGVMWRGAESYFRGSNGHEKNLAKVRELYFEA